MRAKRLTGLLKKGDRVAVSNVTGREASRVSVDSQAYANNIVGGWALGKGGQKLECSTGDDIPVFADCAGLMKAFSDEKKPNKMVVYSPPAAVYGEVKEIISYGVGVVETIFIITEHVSIEVSAKIHSLAQDAGIDVIGCNTLGIINTHDHVRAGAVGGGEAGGSFKPGSATIISNSGNMVNTIASYLLSAGIGTSFGISTGKDALILTPPADFLKLAGRDEKTKIIILYVEPGGLYEQDVIKAARSGEFTKPMVVYVAGKAFEGKDVSLGHAGAVVEGGGTSASAKMELFDEYFGVAPFDIDKRYRKGGDIAEKLSRGIRVTSLHHIPSAAQLIFRMLGLERDLPVKKRLGLNPWFVNLRNLGKRLPETMVLVPGRIPDPWGPQFGKVEKFELGARPTKRPMRNASFASSSDGAVTRIYGRDVTELMASRSFAESLILYWTGEPAAREFEPKLVEMTLIAALTNGPGTISAQGAKLSASAGNSPNTAMIATLAAVGSYHGGNGREAVKFLADIFRPTSLADPYDPEHGLDTEKLAFKFARSFKQTKDAAKEAGIEYKRIPCVGHPIFSNKAVNYDPRERAVSAYMDKEKIYNVFLDFYHHLVEALHEVGVSRNVWAVNVDAVIASVWLGIAWPKLREHRMTFDRAADLAFLGFALGRVAGGAAEYLDHRDHGSPMDSRIPVSECTSLTPPKPLE